MNNKFWVAVYRGSWVALIVMLLVAIICAFRPRYERLRELQNRLARSQNTKRNTEIEIRNLQLRRQQFLTDPAFVERTAREESGMIKSNESVFRLGAEPRPLSAAEKRGGR